MPETLIHCKSAGKKFCRDFKTSLWYGVKDSAADLFQRHGQRAESRASANRESQVAKPELRSGEFWANKDISFEVRRGECLALIGRNGAGKTTLLKMLSGLIRPDAGEIRLTGTVSGLIALGAGFNPVLSGRENIFVNGSILGLSRRQINDRLEKIVEFAELSDAIDSPVQNYSSGMQVRLGFSAAVNLIQPDVLLLDEVLAVGDIGFTIKCLNAMRELTNRCAVIFVTHSMQFVSLFCTHALLLSNGQQVMQSDAVSTVIDAYHGTFSLNRSESGTGKAIVTNLLLKTQDASQPPASHISIKHRQSLTLTFDIQTPVLVAIKLQMNSQNLIPILASDILGPDGQLLTVPPGSYSISIDLGPIDFTAGLYPLVIGVWEPTEKVTLIRLDSAASIRVQKSGVDWGFIGRDFHGTCHPIRNSASLTALEQS